MCRERPLWMARAFHALASPANDASLADLALNDVLHVAAPRGTPVRLW